MPFFNTIALLPEDPILSLNSAFQKDVRKEKVNLGVGTYKTAQLTPLILRSVKLAEEQLISTEQDKDYLPIEGSHSMRQASMHLVYGNNLREEKSQKIYAAQTIGGTGALRIAAEFLSKNQFSTLYIPNPTWPNHQMIFEAARLQVKSYPYYDPIQHQLDFEGMCQAIHQIPAGSAIVLHAVCHNPTGIDPTKEQWKILAELIRKQNLLPLFDFAYQGFGEGIDEDAFPVRYFSDYFDSLIVVNSFSKNIGLYGERLGTLFIQAASPPLIANIASHVKTLIRSNYSNPPCHGARILNTVFSDPALKALWEQELAQMRQRIQAMRSALILKLTERASRFDFTPLTHQRGMFSFCGLNKNQVSRLIQEYGIYMPSNGRINIAGLNQFNLDYVVDALLSVMES